MWQKMTVMARAQSWTQSRFGQALASTKKKTDLYVIGNGTLTALRFSICAGDIGPEFILIDDNARPYRAQVTNAYL